MSKSRPNMARARKVEAAKARVPRSEQREHTSWCVRDHDSGACSAKRGRWDRSTGTWDSDLSDEHRATMREALRRWNGGKGEPHKVVMEWLRLQPGFTHLGSRVMTGWWMTRKAEAAKGREWP